MQKHVRKTSARTWRRAFQWIARPERKSRPPPTSTGKRLKLSYRRGVAIAHVVEINKFKGLIERLHRQPNVRRFQMQSLPNPSGTQSNFAVVKVTHQNSAEK